MQDMTPSVKNLENVTVGAKNLFSLKMLWLIVLTYLIVKGIKILESYLCQFFVEHCSLINKLSLVLLMVSLALFVFRPFSELFGLNNSNNK